MPKKPIGNPLEQAIVSGTIGKKSEPVTEQATESVAIPVRKVGRKPTKKDRVQHTIYLPPVLSKWIKIESYEQGREISDVVADAILLYKEQQDTANK
ncbi:MAG TPA: hypothetical protein VGE97_02910 [Nitrososphaera sp.]|jgi:hypothetical protein